MPMWRCPHCGTPQAETARCWVCRRSSTSCGTCRNYRRAVAGQLGYCGLDKRRQPLTGEEIRGCWEAWPSALLETNAPLTIAPARSGDEAHPPLAFVEVTEKRTADVDTTAGAAEDLSPPVAPMAPSEPGWSLWGDPEA
jgi:hypothetical protein